MSLDPSQLTKVRVNSQLTRKEGGTIYHDSDGLGLKRESREGHSEPIYSVFSRHERWCILAMIALAGMFSPLTSNVYFPAIPSIAYAFHESIESINLTVTAYLILQGLSPSLWGSIADRKGRRISFLLCLLILSLSCVGLALCPTSAYWLLLVLRCIQAAGSASTTALSSGVMADIVPAEHRGSYLGVSNIGPMAGPCIGPVIGGVLSDRLGWRSIFWFLAIAAISTFVVLLLFFPETLRSLVGNGSVPPPKWNRAIVPIIGRSSRDTSSERPPPTPLPNPLKLFLQPDLCILLMTTAIPFAVFSAVLASLAPLFEDTFPSLSETEIGLCYLGIGAGGIIGTTSVGKLLDKQYQFVKRRFEKSITNDSEKTSELGSERTLVNIKDHENFPMEETRLLAQNIWMCSLSISTTGYGWAIQSKTNIAVPLILQFIIGYATVAILITNQSLIVDMFPTQTSSATAANNLVRCLLAAIVVSVINLITDAVGPGWTYTICGVLCALTSLLVLLEMKKGPTWRKRRKSIN